MPTFPYGRAALAIFALALLSLAWAAANPVRPHEKGALVFWTFANTHYDAYRAALPAFEAAHPGVKVEFQLVHGNAISQRLQAAMQAGVDVPDLVEVEIGVAGSFFRGPLNHVGFADLTDRLKAEGLDKEMVASRFAPYTSRGRIFGLPHDVHPVMLAYNREIFAKEGINPDDIKTWDDFIRIGRKLTVPGKRYMVEFQDTNSDHITPLLLQRGGGVLDKDGKVIFDNEIGVETMKWFVPLVAGPKKIGNALGGAQQILTNAVEDGYFVCLVAPDWRTRAFQQDIPRMRGKLGLMPLPAVEPGGRRTSTWGGTMLGISRTTKNPELAWEFAKFLYLNKADLAARFADTNIIPPVRSAWNLPEFNKPREYYGGQAIGAAYAKLAPDTPPQYTSAFVGKARDKISEALIACVAYYNANGERGFDQFVRKQLKTSADEARKIIARNPF